MPTCAYQNTDSPLPFRLRHLSKTTVVVCCLVLSSFNSVVAECAHPVNPPTKRRQHKTTPNDKSFFDECRNRSGKRRSVLGYEHVELLVPTHTLMAFDFGKSALGESGSQNILRLNLLSFSATFASLYSSCIRPHSTCIFRYGLCFSCRYTSECNVPANTCCATP